MCLSLLWLQWRGLQCPATLLDRRLQTGEILNGTDFFRGCFPNGKRRVPRYVNICIYIFLTLYFQKPLDTLGGNFLSVSTAPSLPQGTSILVETNFGMAYNWSERCETCRWHTNFSSEQPDQENRSNFLKFPFFW